MGSKIPFYENAPSLIEARTTEKHYASKATEILAGFALLTSYC